MVGYTSKVFVSNTVGYPFNKASFGMVQILVVGTTSFESDIDCLAKEHPSVDIAVTASETRKTIEEVAEFVDKAPP